jgi:hypothetical protein
LSKEKLREQISSHKCANYEAIRHQNWIPLAQQAEYLKTYSRQLEVFASPSDTIEFKPFAILKGIRQDGIEDLFFHIPNSEQFATVSDDDYAVIDLTQDDALDKANRFFESVLSHEMEGVVVKPDLPYIKGVAPYLKVRSPLYLHIIYGMDYTYEPKYQKLLRQKRIDGKLRTSIDEYEYGKRMLEIPRSEISKDNQDYVNLVAKLILEEKREEKFDPRL